MTNTFKDNSSPLAVDRRDGVAILTLNCPERANVIDEQMGRALLNATYALSIDPSLRAVLLTGSGSVFCGGGNIKEFLAAGEELPQMMSALIPRLHEMVAALLALPVPVVTALNGPVAGGGIGLAWCADIVIAAESMKLRGAYSAIGLTPDMGGSWQMARALGPMRAKRLLFLNEPLSAQECLALGLVSQVVPDAELHRVAHSIVQKLAQGPRNSLSRIKTLINGASDRSLVEQMAMECGYMVEAVASADAAEGLRAFVEKRAPAFSTRG